MKLQEYLTNYRKRYKLSLRSLAERCGCSFQYLAKLENGEIVRPSMKMMNKIAAGMGMTLHDLLSEVDDIVVHLSSDGVEGVAITKEAFTEEYMIQHDEARQELIHLIYDVTRSMPLDEIRHFIKIIEVLYPQYLKEEEE